MFFSLHFVPFSLRLSRFKNVVRSLWSLSECDGGFNTLNYIYQSRAHKINPRFPGVSNDTLNRRPVSVSPSCWWDVKPGFALTLYGFDVRCIDVHYIQFIWIGLGVWCMCLIEDGLYRIVVYVPLFRLLLSWVGCIFMLVAFSWYHHL